MKKHLLSNLKNHFQYIFILGIVITLMILSYSPSFHGGYFADDFAFQFNDDPITLKNIFKPINEYAWRPTETLFLSIFQHLFGLTTFPIHFSYLSVHLVLSLLVMLFMYKTGYSLLSSFIAFCVMALSQANTHAIASIDTFSQISSTFCCYVSIITFLSFVKKGKWQWYITSVIFALIAFFCKETSLFIIPFLIIIGIFEYIRCYSFKWNKIIFLIILLLPFVFIAVSFLVFRNHLGLQQAEFGHNRFNISIGINIIKNFCMAFFQAIQPHSSVDLYFNLVNHKILSIVPVVVFTIIIIALSIVGCIKSKNPSVSLALIALLPSTLFPVILFNQISELYVYNMMPLCAFFIGIGCGTLIETTHFRPIKIIYILFLISFFLWNCKSTYSKCTFLFENGARAEHLLQKLSPYFSHIPDNGTLLLVNPPTSNKTEYSIYKRTGFRLFEDADMKIFFKRSGRNDFSLKIITEKEIATIDTTHSLIITFNNGELSNIHER